MATHRQRHVSLILGSCFLAAVVGCQKATDSARSGDGAPNSDTVAKSVGGQAATGASAAVNRGRAANAGAPEDTVKKFLSAFRKHDDVAARRMLTPTAREQTKEMDLNKDLQVSDKATFAIGEVEVLADQGRAHVQCTWTDIDSDTGEKYSSEMVWICQLEDEGWRIKGLGIKVFPDAEGVILDYENPEEMAATMEAIDQEIARRSQEAEPDRQASASESDAGRDASRSAKRKDPNDVRTASRSVRRAEADDDRATSGASSNSLRGEPDNARRTPNKTDRAAVPESGRGAKRNLTTSNDDDRTTSPSKQRYSEDRSRAKRDDYSDEESFRGQRRGLREIDENLLREPQTRRPSNRSSRD